MRARSIKQASLLLAALVALLAPSFAGYQAQTVSALDCSFRYGFADLHAQVPQVVGDCVENEHHLANTGDGLQETTRGLLAAHQPGSEPIQGQDPPIDESGRHLPAARAGGSEDAPGTTLHTDHRPSRDARARSGLPIA